ncbi:MAG: pyridoxal phosphate-dependent aminotransferase [Bacteroidota bacterium]|jgi:hypothetical protein
MVFSSRLPDDLSENRLSRRVRELCAAGTPLLDLTLSNPTHAGFHYPAEELREAFARAADGTYEPHPRGLRIAREAIARYYGEERSGAEAAARSDAARSDALQRAEGEEASGSGFPIDPEHLHCTASSSEAYSMLFKLLCDPGDEICIPLPAYPLFSWLAALDAVTVRPYNLRLAPNGHWQIDMHSLDMAMSARTRAVIVVNPSNPAANYLRPEELAQLDSLCARNRVALVTDEVFWDFPLREFRAAGNGSGISMDGERKAGKLGGKTDAPDGKTDAPGGGEIGTDAIGIAITRQRTAGIAGEALRFTINGFSKLLALPQMKLGWILTEGSPRLRDEALARLDVIADSYLSVGTPVMAAAPALLELRENIQSQIRARCLRNLRTTTELLGDHSSGGLLLQPEGGWNALITLPDDADEEAISLRLLEEHRVLVHPGYLFDFARGKYLVVSLLGNEFISTIRNFPICW